MYQRAYKMLIAFFTLSSIQCNKPPCICDFSAVQFLEIKIVNQQNQNLIVGQYAKYNMDSIRVIEQKNNFNINNASVRMGLVDSNNVRFDFYKPADKSYLYYDHQTQQDSIEIKWLTKTGNCCGSKQSYNFIDSVKFNNAFIKPINGVYYFVK